MKRKLFRVHLCAQLDGLGMVWSVTTDSAKRGVAFFKRGRFTNSSEDLYLILRTRTYDFFAEDCKAAIVLPGNVNAKLVFRSGDALTREASFDGNVGELLDSKYLLDVGQTLSGCSIISKWHPNCERYILVPPTKILETGSVNGLEKGEIVLIRLEQRLCPYGTKWFVSELTTGKSGFVTLRDARFLDKGSVIFTKYAGDDANGRALFTKPFKSISDNDCEFKNVKVYVKYGDGGNVLWNGNLMRLDSVAEESIAEVQKICKEQGILEKESIAGSQVLLDLRGERVSESTLKKGKGLLCKIIGRRGNFFITVPVYK